MAKKKNSVLVLEESSTYENIKNSLLIKLQEAGNDTEFYNDFIEDYMSLWITKTLLVDDIKTRGVVVVYNNGGGQKGKKKNESISELNKTNAQMLKLLESLGIKASLIAGGSDPPDDDL